MASITVHSDFGVQENKIGQFPLFSHQFAMKWWDQMSWSSFFECWALSQHFSLSSFTLTKGLFSSSLLSAIRVVSSANVRLLIFLLAIFIPAWDSSSPTFYLMYSVNKQGDKIQLWCTPFPIWNQSIIPCPVLAVASGPEYRFLRRQARWSGIPISLRIFQFVVIHTVKDFSQWGRNRFFFLIPLLFLWSNQCWPFDFWLLCLF